MNYKEEYEKCANNIVKMITELNDTEQFFEAHYKIRPDDLTKEVLESIRKTRSLSIVYLAEVNKAKNCNDVTEMIEIIQDTNKIHKLLLDEEKNTKWLLIKAKLLYS